MSTEDEKYAALTVPSIACNRYFLMINDGGVRFIVGEKFDNQPTKFHQSFLLSHEEAKKFADLITTALNEHQLKQETGNDTILRH